jgi:predicted peptidase
MKINTLGVLASILALFVPAVAVTHATTQATSTRKISPEASKLAPLFKSGDFKDDKGNRLPYRYFEPSVKTRESAKVPVILYLHGEDEAGTDNNAQLTTTECATIWVEPDHLAQHPVYVLAPQILKGKNWTDEPVYSNTLALLDQFMKSHPAADTNRIYIVGFSMGGNGLWKMLLKNPKLFTLAIRKPGPRSRTRR